MLGFLTDATTPSLSLDCSEVLSGPGEEILGHQITLASHTGWLSGEEHFPGKENPPLNGLAAVPMEGLTESVFI